MDRSTNRDRPVEHSDQIVNVLELSTGVVQDIESVFISRTRFDDLPSQIGNVGALLSDL